MNDSFVKKLKAAWLVRHPEVSAKQLMAFRWVNGAGDGLPGFFVDVYCSVLLVTYESLAGLPPLEMILKSLKQVFLECTGQSLEEIFLRDHSRSHQDTEGSPNSVLVKSILEEGLLFEVHIGEGPHTGLFLDQRENRRWVTSQSAAKRVLNLFCYTGAFTVAALQGGAEQVVSVDLSKPSLAWLERNLTLNGMLDESGRSVIHDMDVFEYLKRAKARSEKFGLVIVDPPSFSRSKRGVFSTQRDLKRLIEAVLAVTQDDGQIFVSINTRAVTPLQFESELLLACTKTGFKPQKYFSMPKDFCLSASDLKNPPLKACVLVKV